MRQTAIEEFDAKRKAVEDEIVENIRRTVLIGKPVSYQSLFPFVTSAMDALSKKPVGREHAAFFEDLVEKPIRQFTPRQNIRRYMLIKVICGLSSYMVAAEGEIYDEAVLDILRQSA